LAKVGNKNELEWATKRWLPEKLSTVQTIQEDGHEMMWGDGHIPAGADDVW
jgi:hypothetical protein